MTILLKVMADRKLTNSDGRCIAGNQCHQSDYRQFSTDKIHRRGLLVTIVVFTLLPLTTCTTNDVPTRAMTTIRNTTIAPMNAILPTAIEGSNDSSELDDQNAKHMNFNRNYNYNNFKMQISENLYTEDLEQTIRNAVKTEIENEQDIAVSSSRLMNNINDYSHVKVDDITKKYPAKETIISDTENNEIDITGAVSPVPVAAPIPILVSTETTLDDRRKVDSISSNDEVSSNFSIELEESLKATESSVDSEPHIGTSMYDLNIEMLNEKTTYETTTEILEETVHNVIKKQGVNPEDAFVIPDEVLESENNLNRLDSENITTFDLSETTYQSEFVEFSTLEDNLIPTTTIVSPFVENTETTNRIPQEYSTNQDIQDDDQVVTQSTIAVKGSRSLSIDSLDDNIVATLFESYTPRVVEQTFNEHLAAESFQDIEKIATNDGNGRSLLIVMVCASSAVLFVAISVAMYLISFQRQHGTLDIEMQERRCGKDDEDLETCQKLLEIELPVLTIAIADDTDE